MNRDSFQAFGTEITVNSRKYDDRVRRTWEGGLVTSSDELIVLVGRFAEEVKHHDLGRIRKGTISFEYFWTDRWYNIFRFHKPDGSLKAYYCNVAMPPKISDGVIDFVDLDIDVVVWPDKTYEVLDLDDFEQNTLKYSYPARIQKAAKKALKDLIAMIEADELPQPL